MSLNRAGVKSNINFINWYAKEPQRDAPIEKVLFINKVLRSSNQPLQLKLFIKKSSR